MFLMSSLDNNTEEYQAVINVYNKCSDPAVCTLGKIHSDMLSQNSSFILKYVHYITNTIAISICILCLQC